METITKDYAVIDGAKIYYESTGRGTDVLLAHAAFVDNRMWDEQFAMLAQHYRVTRFDMRGFGKSDALQGPVARRKELAGLMKHLKIDNAALIGCSLGGGVALDFALENPEKVSALVLVSTVAGGFELKGEPPAELLEMFAAFEQNDLERVSDSQVRLWVDGPFRSPEQVNARVRQHVREMSRVPAANRTYLIDLQPVESLDPPAITRLGELKMPVLIVAGGLENPEILRAAAFMEAEILGARKVVLPDSVHLPNMEKPAEFNQVVLAFLKEAI